MIIEIETEQETDGRWIAAFPSIPSVTVDGATDAEAIQKSKNSPRM